MNINIQIKVTFLTVITFVFAVLVLQAGVTYAADSYKDCEKFDKQSRQEECEDEVYKKKLKECTGDTPTDSKATRCEKTVPKQPYVVEKEKNKNSDSGTDPLAQTLSDKPPVNGAPSEKDVYEYSCNAGDNTCLERNPIVKWLNVLINITAGIIGVGAVLMLIVAGIQYITSRDNAQGVADAKKKIINVVIGLAAFIFLYAFLNWLIPGGVFA